MPPHDQAVTLSILDRLIDEDPRASSEAPPTRAQAVRHLKDSVRRDLEWLLNTRRIAVPPDESLREVNHSVYVFGVPDFTALSLASNKDQTKLLRHLQSSLKMFEPRLSNARLIPLENSAPGSRTLRFRIEALLLMDPAPEHVSFDTVLQLTSGAYEVNREG